MNYSAQNYYLKAEPTYIPHQQRIEYSPNNNTNQNIELYEKKKLLLSQNNQNLLYNLSPQEQGFNQISYIPTNNYQNIPFNSLKNQYYNQSPELFSPQIQYEMKQNYINNSNIKDNNTDLSYNQYLKKNLISDNNIKTNINSNTEENNTINNSNNKNKINNIENKENKEKKENNENKEKNEVEDPDEYMFREQENKNDKNSKKDDNESELSSDSDKNSENEIDYTDHLLAQYEKVKRIKNKWKVTLKGCVVQKDNKEYVCGKVHGELEREW